MRIAVGRGLEGFVSAGVSSHDVLYATNSTVVMYLNPDVKEKFSEYYCSIKAVLTNNNNSLLVLLDGIDEQLTSSIANLCLLYGCYSLYKITDVAQLNKNYINELLLREPSREEVQMYISASGATEDAMSECILKLSELCKSGDDVGISDFIMDNLETLLWMPSVFDKLRAYEDPSNRVKPEEYSALMEELEKARQELNDNIAKSTELSIQIKDQLISIDQMKGDMERQVNEYNTLTRQYGEQKTTIESLSEENKRLTSQLGKNGMPGMSMYTSLATNRIAGSQVKIVIYLKEISRPKYFNSFITYLCMALQKPPYVQREATKLLIYDDRLDYIKLYGDLRVCNEESFFTERTDILAKDKLVVTDTNPAYLNEMFSTGDYGIYVIVDRLHKTEDLLVGPNVIKFYTFASRSDYELYTRNYGSLEENTAIVHSDKPVDNVINLSTIENYGTGDTARLLKYTKMVNAGKRGEQRVFDLLLSKCGIFPERKG